jgi:hypothetical protein
MLIVGYGVSNGLQYWQIQNTWGKYWGNNGFFKMRRGFNDMGMESDTTTSDPIGGTPISPNGTIMSPLIWLANQTVTV